MNHLRLVLLLLATSFSACEEATIEPELFGQLSGTVVTDANGAPVANATVTTSPATNSLTTDASGHFDFGEVQTGTYTVRVEKSGFSIEIETVVVKEDEQTAVQIRLKKDDANNFAPETPTYVSPANGAVNQAVATILKWRTSEDKDGDAVKYTVLIFNSGGNLTDTLIQNSPDTTFAATLNFNTEYFWQVLAIDGDGAFSNGPVWRFKTISPPDNRILFARKLNGKYDVWSCNATGGDQVKLTSGNGNFWRPRYRFDRKKIAFLSDQNIDNQLFTMNADGTNIQQITNLPVSGYNNLDLDFCWKPDGSALIYMHQNRLYRINADGTGLSLFAEAPAGFTFTEVDWNSAAHAIAARITGSFIYETRIIFYNEAGTLLNTSVPDDAGGLQGGHFFPDGTKILYSRDDLGFNSTDGRQLDARLKVRTIVSGAVADFSTNKTPGTNDLDPRYSPDGSKVIFVNTNNDGISQRNVWITDGSTAFSARVKILDNAEMPDWK